MTLTSEFIHQVATERNLDIPPRLHNWLLIEYETGPFDDFFLEDDLRELITMHYDAYVRGTLDAAPDDPVTRWKNRYEGMQELLDEYRCLYHELSMEYEQAVNLLDQHNIPHQFLVYDTYHKYGKEQKPFIDF